MKNKEILVVILVILLIPISIMKEKLIDKKSDVPYLDITYKEEGACLTFYKDGEYSMYDCDSEPTSYSFDSENECKYSYIKEKNKIIFTCKNSVYKKRRVEIKVLELSEEKIKFIYENEEKTFVKE